MDKIILLVGYLVVASFKVENIVRHLLLVGWKKGTNFDVSAKPSLELQSHLVLKAEWHPKL